jgi:uncharacterized protein (DUF362 family)
MNSENDQKFAHVAFACQTEEPNDQEIKDMIDDVIYQTFGQPGLHAIIKPGDHVVLKANIVCCNEGARGEKGRGIITDPRIARYVAEKVREIIGMDNGADLKVVEACYYPEVDPSLKIKKTSFHWARLKRVHDNTVSAQDICYDYDRDGYLDGESHATLINLDSLGEDERELRVVPLASGHTVKVAFPKFLRKREETDGNGDFTDVLIGLPVFKNHGFLGCTGSLKLHYGFRSLFGCLGDTGRSGHSGFRMEISQDGHVQFINRSNLYDYIIAQHLVRSYDFVIMDCLTANRNGPGNPNGAVTIAHDPDMPVDYILTNALMASTDPVALDAVETAFAGYKQESVELPAVASQNGIGISDPAHIILDSLERFKYHRLRLIDAYGKSGRYPLSTSGMPALQENIEPRCIVMLTQWAHKADSDGQCHIGYCIKSIIEGVDPDICRVDLYAYGNIISCKTEGDLLQGEFIIKPSDFPFANGRYFSGTVLAWDRSFNCISAAAEFFIAPEGCKD